jgi:hypothetical protein
MRKPRLPLPTKGSASKPLLNRSVDKIHADAAGEADVCPGNGDCACVIADKKTVDASMNFIPSDYTEALQLDRQ